MRLDPKSQSNFVSAPYADPAQCGGTPTPDIAQPEGELPHCSLCPLSSDQETEGVSPAAATATGEVARTFKAPLGPPSPGSSAPRARSGYHAAKRAQAVSFSARVMS